MTSPLLIQPGEADRSTESEIAEVERGILLTSLDKMVNWARSHGRPVEAGEVISTGTCTGHLFAQSGDVVSADFASLGVVQVEFT